MEQFTRQIMLPEIGPEGQQQLAEASVLVVGLGGLGSPASQYLTAAGVGRIGLCDRDVVSITNLNRQTLYGHSLLGRPKIEEACKRLGDLAPSTTFELWPDGLTADNAADIVARYDLVVDCCDNHATRFLIDDICRSLGKPWVYGSIGAFQGRASTFLPGSDGFAKLYPDRDALCATPPSAGGVIGAVPGIIGAVEAAEAVKLICGFGTTLAGRLLAIDVKNMIFNVFGHIFLTIFFF